MARVECLGPSARIQVVQSALGSCVAYSLHVLPGPQGELDPLVRLLLEARDARVRSGELFASLTALQASHAVITAYFQDGYSEPSRHVLIVKPRVPEVGDGYLAKCEAAFRQSFIRLKNY